MMHKNGARLELYELKKRWHERGIGDDVSVKMEENDYICQGKLINTVDQQSLLSSSRETTCHHEERAL